ncbi:hypothetical protein KUCAC02_028323, partial [Chaenocephalus aceratus]
LTLSSRCVTERSPATQEASITARPSRCHCSVINVLSRRCAMGPGLTPDKQKHEVPRVTGSWDP